MKMIRTLQISMLTLALALVPFGVFAQRTMVPSENPFLNREYWEAIPSISDIEATRKEGHSITESNGAGFDATTFAIFGNNPVSTIKYLVNHGNSVNKRTHDSRTYIFWAASRGNLEVMKFLIENGAKLDLTDSHGYGPVSFAAATGQQNTEIYDYFIASGINLEQEKDHHGKNPLLVAIGRAKDLKLIDYFISKGLDLYSTDDHGNGAFHYAAQGGSIDILKELKKRSVPISKNKSTGENAIFFASMGRGTNLELIMYLESLGLDANVSTLDGKTPLHNLAKSSDDIELFDYFISKGVDPNAVDKEGNTALLNAAQRNDLKVVQYFTEKATDIDHADDSGRTALSIAVQNNSAAVVSYLVSQGADVHLVDNEGHNLAFYLFDTRGMPRDFDAKASTLESNGFDFTKLQGDDSSVWHLAVTKNDIGLLKKVAAFGSDINGKDKDGNTPLHYAAMKTENGAILKYLISKGANQKATTMFGETAYDLASENELLAKNKVNIEFLN